MIPEDARQEIKFVTNHFNYDRVIQWIKFNEYGFFQSYPDRLINNIYFDTYDYDLYAANISGQSERIKIRFRWYGENQYPSSGCLEIKNRRNFFGWKNIYPVSNGAFNFDDNWRTIIKKICNQVPREASELLLSCQPVIINRYKRSYFVSIDNKVRITVDQNQKVFDQRYKCFPDLGLRPVSQDSIVIEAKFNRNDKNIAGNVLQDFPVRVSRNSKFMNSVDIVSGNRI